MGKIFVVGVGCGGEEYVTPAAKKVIAKCDILVGGSKALKLFARAKKKKKRITGDIDSILGFIKKNRDKNIAVLTSGDPGFFSILAALLKKIPRSEIEVIPGISSVQLCFARMREPWQDARFLSLHGREGFRDALNWIKKNRKISILTDSRFTPQKIASLLLENGIKNTRAVVCENLSLPNERVVDSTLARIAKQKFSGNCVMVVLNEASEPLHGSCGFGIPDEEFIRGGAPMTKQEVRAVTLSRAGIKPQDAVYDIGAGTGSISIEAALLGSKVYAIEKEVSRIALIEKNIKKFHAENIETIHGKAPEVLGALPPADVIVIGGSGGKMEEILRACHKKLKRGGRIVVNAITIDTLKNAISVMKKLNYPYSVALVSVSRLEKLGGSELFKAQNPVFVIAAEKR